MSDNAGENDNLRNNDETPRATKRGPEDNKKHGKHGGGHGANEEVTLEATKSMSKSATVPGVEEDALKPLWVAEKIVERPCSTCCCIFIFVVILAAIDMITFELSEEHDRTWFVEESDVVENLDQWELAEDALKNAGGDNVYVDPQTTEENDWVIFFMFELREYSRAIDVNDPNATNYWILTPENLELIMKYEEMVTKDEEWKNNFCYVENTETYECVYTSLARDVAQYYDYNYANMTTEGIKKYILDFYYSTDSPGTVESSFNEKFAETNQTFLYRSFLKAGAPITTDIRYTNGTNGTNGTMIRTSKYRNINHKEDDQEEDYTDWVDDYWQDITVDENAKLKDGNLKIVFIEGTVFNLEFNVLLLQAMGWVVAAIASVIIWMTIHLQSAFLSLTAVGEILLSFPFAFFLYRYILQIDHFDTLSTLIIFVLLGVGADDVFVFTDAWRQSLHFVHNKFDLKQRMSFAYRRAAKAMLVTQVTTFFAFLATAFSRIMPISAFGIWAAAIVFCNYLLVISMYPALLMIHHNYVRSCERKYCCCCCPNEDDDENEGNKQSKSETEMKKQSEKDKKRSKNDQETVELTTAAAKQKQSISPRKEEIDTEDLEDEGQMPPPLISRQSTVAEQSEEYTILERFFAVKWANWINMFKIPVLVLFAVLFAMAIWRGGQIEEQDEEEQWFPNGHFMKETLDMMDKFTSSEESGLVYVIFLWGTNGINRDNTDRWDPDDYGKLKWDNNFDVSSIEAQVWFYEKCENFTQNPLVFQETSVTCVLTAFEEYLLSIGETFPYTYIDILNDTDASGNSSTLWDEEEQKLQFAQQLYYFSQSSYANHINQDSLLFVDKEDNFTYNVRYIAIGLYTAIGFDANIDDSLDVQDDLDLWLDDNFRENDNCPNGICKPIQASFRWCWLKTNKEFINSAIQGIAIALPLAFVVLIISTQNWIMAIFATLDIIGVMSCELMVMELFGWKFGVSESVAIVIVIGFSVDYVVHLANAFLESNGGIRSERTQFALLTMGISVVSGAITTFLAGFFLQFPPIIFFYKMGILIMTTIAFSLAWSMFFFIALLSLLGPQHETGNIPCAKIAQKIFKRDNDD